MKIEKPQIYEIPAAMFALKKKVNKLKRCLLKTYKNNKVIVFPNLNPYLPVWIEVYITIETNVYHFTIDTKKLNQIIFPYNVLPDIKKAINIMYIMPEVERKDETKENKNE